MEEIGKKYEAEYTPDKYHMMLAKQGSRGIIMEPEGILGNYLVTDKVLNYIIVYFFDDVWQLFVGHY